MKLLLELSSDYLAMERAVAELKKLVASSNSADQSDLWGYLPQEVYSKLEYMVSECYVAGQNLRKSVTAINNDTFDKDGEVVPWTHVEVWHQPPRGFGEHEHVATLNVGGNGKDKENLAKAFTATQNGDGCWGENPEVVKLHLPEPRSTSVGDLLVSNGRVWEVQKRGFRDLVLNHNPLLEKK
jgi:hypothetical protein